MATSRPPPSIRTPTPSEYPHPHRDHHRAPSNQLGRDASNVPWGLMLAQDLDPHAWAQDGQSSVSHPSAWLDPFYDTANVVPPDDAVDPAYSRGIEIPVSNYPARYSGIPRVGLGRNGIHPDLPHGAVLDEVVWPSSSQMPISAPVTTSAGPPVDLGLPAYPPTTRTDFLDESSTSFIPSTIPPSDFSSSYQAPLPPAPNDWFRGFCEVSFPDARLLPPKVYIDSTGPGASPQIDYPILPHRLPEEKPVDVPVGNRQTKFQVQKSEQAPTSVSKKIVNPAETSTALVLQKPSSSTSTDLVQTKRSTATFDDCITIFETVPGAIAQSKRRRKLDEASHKSFKVTRKIGACLECRFRKRTCNPGTPCQYCQKIFGRFDTAHLNCYRESPFIGFEVSDYFLLSSKKRIVDFKVKPIALDVTQPTAYITIDGTSGPCNLSLKVPVYQRLTSTLSLEEQAEIWRTKRQGTKTPKSGLPECLTMIAEDDETLGAMLEAWAIKYSSKFSRYYSSRYPTAYAYNVGTLYVSRRLPEWEVVQVLIRAVALSYILRAGVKVSPSSPFKTVEAKIDTILYQRVREVESKLFAMMQKLVWVSAGRLKRQQMYPVAYVIWQCMRMMCLRSSHLANIVDRTKESQRLKQNTFEKDADHLRHCFQLLLATHTALFRADSPLLLDFTDRANQDLLGHDPELIDEAMRLRSVILNFKENSLSKPLKASRWYREMTYKKFRSVLDGRGMSE